MESEKATGITINGDVFAMLILDELRKAKEEGRTYNLSSWRTIVSSGVRLSPGVKRKLCEFLPQLVIQDMYGCTEFSVAYNSVAIKEDADVAFPGAVLPARGGLFSMQAPFKVVNPETGTDVKPGTEEIGEFAAGGYVSLGYWKCPARTKRKFKLIKGKRYFFTGDDGFVDKDMRFCFIGRGGKEVMNIAGDRVYSEEVAEVIKTNPKVRDVAVVGVPDKELGKAITAIIQLEKGEDLTEEDIVEYCSRSLQEHKVPKHVIFVVSLPREVTGKMEKKVINEFVQGRLGRED
jgi:fatty-acyl-CoA synthase